MLEHPAMKAAIWMMIDWTVVMSFVVPTTIIFVIATRAHAEEAPTPNPQCVKWMKARKMPEPEKRCLRMAESQKNLADAEKKKQEEAKK